MFIARAFHHGINRGFYVVEGKLLIDFEDRTVELASRQGIVVPRGVQHRPRAPERALELMVEAATVNATGDK